MKKKLVVLGSINVDHIIHLTNLPTGGETVMGHEYLLAYGGKGANQAVAAGRFGANISFLGAIGEDSTGQQMLEQFNKDGIDTSRILKVKNTNTGVAMIFVDEKAENVIAIYPGANEAVDEEYVYTHKDKINSADYLLMQLETPIEALVEAAKIAKKNNTLVVLNPAPARYLPSSLLENVDYITPNETEAFKLTGILVTDKQSAAKASSILHDKGINTVLITLGSKGVWLSQNYQGELVPAFLVEAIDTIAAGDTFNGVFVTELLNGKDAYDAVISANAAAALSVTKKGAQPSIPMQNEVNAFLKMNYLP